MYLKQVSPGVKNDYLGICVVCCIVCYYNRDVRFLDIIVASESLWQQLGKIEKSFWILIKNLDKDEELESFCGALRVSYYL